MNWTKLASRLLLCALAFCHRGGLSAKEPAPRLDPRNFAHGRLIPDEDYCDQPRIVVTKDGTWVCVLTTGPAHEGGAGQHVVATRSADKGKTWSPLVDIEPAKGSRISSYAIALITPADRVYAFYCYNGDGIDKLPDGKPIRHDMQGWCSFRYSDDKGQTWSERHRVPMRLTAVDRNNDWQGKLQMWWAIGTPAIAGRTAMFGFTKLGRYILHDGEGWFFRSDNILTERDPEKIEWQMLPEGDHGVRALEFGSVQEEFDVVHLGGDDFYSVYRTTMGHAAASYTRDGGRTWEKPQPLTYTPGGQVVKQSRACTKIWKTRDGNYLLWFHNNATTTYNNGMNAGSRNIAWLSGGRVHGGRMHWSQPEIVAYVDGSLEGCSYPDLIKDGGKYYISATQKTEARVMEVEAGLLDALWNQQTVADLATNALLLNLAGEQCASGTKAPAPRLAPLSGEIHGRGPLRGLRTGFTVEVGVRFSDLSPGQVLVDARDAAGVGYTLRTTDRQTLRFELCDGWAATHWDCDTGLLTTNTDHHVAVIVDGGPKVISFVVDGRLCDGGKERLFGFGRFTPNFKDVSGARELRIAANVRGTLQLVRIYNRALRTTEAIGNFRAAQPPAASNSRSR